LHISKQFAELIKAKGEEQIMHIVKVWDKRRIWQRERYAKVVKPTRLAAKGARPRVLDEEVVVEDGR
jgi:hypothetical protein